MKTLHSVTRTVTFHVLAENIIEAEQLAVSACPIDEAPSTAIIDTCAYLTLNQSDDLKRRTINYE